jgi:hypothetical protein
MPKHAHYPFLFFAPMILPSRPPLPLSKTQDGPWRWQPKGKEACDHQQEEAHEKEACGNQGRCDCHCQDFRISLRLPSTRTRATEIWHATGMYIFAAAGIGVAQPAAPFVMDVCTTGLWSGGAG